jgi:ribonuclease J
MTNNRYSNNPSNANHSDRQPLAKNGLAPKPSVNEIAREFIRGDGRTLRMLALGGLHELGKNMFVFESYDDKEPKNSEYIIIDAGLRHYGHDNPGIDYAIADFNYLKNKKERIKALILSSPNYRHCGGAHQLICSLEIKNVYGPQIALELVKLELNPETVSKISWHKLESRVALDLSPFTIKPFFITSPNADSYALLIEAHKKKVFYSGSFKLDQTPLYGEKTDIAGILAAMPTQTEFGRAIDLYIGCSTNVETSGYSLSELELVPNFKRILSQNSSKRILINTYDSNFTRIQLFLNLAKEFNRKVALLHRNIRKAINAGRASGLLTFDEELLISISEIGNYKDSEILILTSSAEDLALEGLELVAFNKSVEFILREGDVVINSGDLPAGTVRIMAQISDQCFLKEVQIIGGKNASVHVESYALTEELKFMFNVVKPHYFIPALGETRQLVKHAKLAVETGFDPGSILILDNGDLVEFADNNIVKVIEQIKYEEVLYSTLDHYELEDHIIKSRDVISREGVVIISFSINKNKKIVSGPVFSAKACTFSKNKEWRAFCMFNTQPIAEAVENLFTGKPSATLDECESIIKNLMDKVIKQQIGKRPELIVVANQI